MHALHVNMGEKALFPFARALKASKIFLCLMASNLLMIFLKQKLNKDAAGPEEEEFDDCEDDLSDDELDAMVKDEIEKHGCKHSQ